MGLVLLLFGLAFALAYVAAMAVPVLAMARLGRVGAAAGVVAVGFAARWAAGRFHEVWASEPLSIAYLPFFVGVALAMHLSTRVAPDAHDVPPSPLRDLSRTPHAARRRMDRNLLALTFVVVPATVVLDYAGEYLQRTALGYQTDYLALNTSWDYARHFESGPLGLGLVLFLGGLLYESVLLRLPAAGSGARADRRALLLLPLMLVPWVVLGAATSLTSHGIALVQGLALYFFLVRRFPFPVAAVDRAPALVAVPDVGRDAGARSELSRKRRYALMGGALGAAVAGFALSASGLQDSGALAIAAEQLFFLGLPTSLPLRSILVTAGDLRYESSVRLVIFVLVVPVVNGAFLGWTLGRAAEAWRRGARTQAREDARRSSHAVG